MFFSPVLLKGKPPKLVIEYWLKQLTILICLLNGMHKEFKHYQIRYIIIKSFRNLILDFAGLQCNFFSKKLFIYLFWFVFRISPKPNLY